MIAWLRTAVFASVLAGGALTGGLVGPAAAQDAAKVAPQTFRVVLDNDRVRVMEARFRPGDKIGLHSHPDHLYYALTDGSLVLKPPGRTPYEITLTVGEALWLPAQTRGVENAGDKDVRVLVMELKGASARVSRRAGGRRGARARRGGRR
jgi:quercetin dioxygenase-like cupin family protein